MKGPEVRNFVAVFLELLHQSQHWGKLMADIAEIHATMDRIAAGQAAITEDVENVRSALAAVNASNADLSAQVATLTQTVADLQAQIASGAGVSQADLDSLAAQATALAEGVEAQDAALDAIAPPAVP